MAAKGALAKEEIMNKILATFPGSFKYEKEIRVPMMENGEMLQIKVTLTAAKNMVDNGADVAIPGDMSGSFAPSPAPAQLKQDAATMVEPTEAEKQNIRNLMSVLGLQK